MRCVYLVNGKIVIKDVEIPKLEDGDILIKVKYALTDGTDLKTYLRGHHIIKDGPFGHEYSGIVVESRSEKFKVGDEVFGLNSAYCGNCKYCKESRENLCISLKFLFGAYAEYLKIPKEIVNKNVFIKPKEISFKVAPIIEPLSCVFNGIEKLNLKGNENILILGSGSIAIMFFLALSENHNVKIHSRSKDRLKLIKDKLLYEQIEKSFMKEYKDFDYSIVIDTTASFDLVNEILKNPRRGSKILLFSGMESEKFLTFEQSYFHYNEIDIITSFHHKPTSTKKAYEYLRRNHMILENIITTEVELSDIEKAFFLMKERKALKVAISVL
ncbi:MAG: alcohol dehydrogenase catalytic domain-containing protein [candidate division WOR-3 bacterium]|nr:alcohol dehydrogenase catalytic domain-containing protein [candidate division WOR-3 bacterium]MCX7947278.1 alcohol dehydrogenase catalytic domain-containing protein [candidate division WOR-3 bacterium]MDW8150165.1 alcohol dehydrogenase catalytic domain-containing protein [candidate division WOR-3 bacterium]